MRRMTSGVKESAPGRDGRSRRWDAHRAQRRGEFVRAAIAAITEHGPQVHVEQIARMAGVPRPVLYRHFKDRADLDAAIAHRAGELLLAELAPALEPSGTPLAAIRRLVETYLSWVESRPQLYRFVVRRAAGHDESATVRATVASHATALLTGYFRAYGADPTLVEPLAFGLVGMTDAAVDRWLQPGAVPVDRARLADRLTAATWNVLAGELRAGGVEVDPHGPLPSRAPSGVNSRG